MKKTSFDRLASGAAWSIVGKAVQTVVTLATLVVIARMVGPEAYGVFALTWITVGLIEIFATMAPIDTLVQRRELRPGHLNATFWASLVVGFLGLGCLTLAAGEVAGFLQGGALLEEILPARALTLPLGALAVVPIGLLMREARFKAIAGIESLASVAASLVGLAFAFGGAGVWSLVFMEIVRAFATAAVGFLVARWRPGVRMGVTDFTDLLGFNASTWGAWGIVYLDGELPRTLIARSLGSTAVGLYSMAMRLFDQVVTLLMRPAYQVVQTGAARTQDDPVAVGELALGTMRASVVLAAPLFLGIAAISPVLIPLVFGAEWVGAVGVIQVMMLFAVRSPVTMVQTAIIRGMGKAHWHLGVAALGVCLTLAVLWVSLPYGLVAVAAAMGVRGILLFPSYAILVRRLTGLSVRDQALASVGATVAALVMAAAVLGALAWLSGIVADAAALAIAVPSGAVVYWAALRLFSRQSARVVDAVLAALVRRDRAGLRAALGGAAGS